MRAASLAEFAEWKLAVLHKSICAKQMAHYFFGVPGLRRWRWRWLCPVGR